MYTTECSEINACFSSKWVVCTKEMYSCSQKDRLRALRLSDSDSDEFSPIILIIISNHLIISRLYNQPELTLVLHQCEQWNKASQFDRIDCWKIVYIDIRLRLKNARERDCLYGNHARWGLEVLELVTFHAFLSFRCTLLSLYFLEQTVTTSATTWIS